MPVRCAVPVRTRLGDGEGVPVRWAVPVRTRLGYGEGVPTAGRGADPCAVYG